MIGLPRRYPMGTYPYARDADEENYFRLVHYLASALYVVGVGDDALQALHTLWQDVIDRQSTVLAGAAPPGDPAS